MSDPYTAALEVSSAELRLGRPQRPSLATVAALQIADEQAASLPPPWPAPLDLADLGAQEPELPRMVIPDWLPCGYATLMAGHGGVGKSGIALQLAACLALGLPWWGIPTEARRVLYLSCEDRTGVLHWRLARICRHMAISLDRLQNRLDVLDLVGHDSVLWEHTPRTGATLTAAYGELQARMIASDTEILIVDGISDTYGGQENVRGEVKRYVNSLVSLIPPDRGAVLLVGHVAKPAASGIPTNEGYSGSTAWHNSVRSRWYLKPNTRHGDDSEAERTGELVLELQKSNLGRSDQAIRFHWDENAHLFVGRSDASSSTFDRRLRDQTELDGILEAFKGCAADGIDVPAATTGRRTAFHVLSARQEFPETLRNKVNTPRFWRQIESLRHMRAISEASIRRSNRHYLAVLTLHSADKSGSALNASNATDSDSTQIDARRTAPNAPNGAGGYRGCARATTNEYQAAKDGE